MKKFLFEGQNNDLVVASMQQNDKGVLAMALHVQTIYERLMDWFWCDDRHHLSGFHQWIIVPVRMLMVLARDLFTGQLNLRAMSLVYTTLLSVVPLLAVSFSVLKGFGVHDQLEPVLLNILAPLGPKGVELSDILLALLTTLRWVFSVPWA